MEIVAPAGSRSALRAAICAGADAVYLGLPEFGARAKAENFDETSLAEAVRYAHLFGTRVFVTLNTLIKDSELDRAVKLAKFAFDSGVDAAIVQDIRFIKRLKSDCPDLPLHGSTQMGIHNAEGARVLQDMGIKRAVLSRETLPEDIEQIKKTGIEVEFFVQGALCVAFSGNCYFSSLASGYSGNRGKCMQLCRKQYTLRGKNGYFLSAKDICLYEQLNVLRELGVDAVKIEGRMRSDEYVYRAVSVYKSDMSAKEAKEDLSEVFDRGDYCTAYMKENAPFDIIYPHSQGNIGKSVGKIDVVKGSVISVRGFVPHENDGFKIFRGTKEIGGATVRGGKLSADCDARVGDELRRTSSGALREQVKSIKRALPIDVNIIVENDFIRAEACCRGEKVSASRSVQPAEKAALSKEDVIRAFAKSGDLPLEPMLNVEVCAEVFAPISALNGLRRELYSALRDRLCAITRTEQKPFALSYNKFDGHGTILAVDNFDVLNEDIVAKADYIALDPNDYNGIADPPSYIDKPIMLVLPVTMRGDDRAVIGKALAKPWVSAVVSNNYYTLKFTDKPILLGVGHNIIGECDLPQINSVEADVVSENAFNYVYGRAPLMNLCHCPYGKCIDCDGKETLTDEAGRVFELRRKRSAHCYWQMLNCLPTDIRREAGNNPDKYFDCTGMSADDILSVLDGDPLSSARTRGNITKGLK